MWQLPTNQYHIATILAKIAGSKSSAVPVPALCLAAILVKRHKELVCREPAHVLPANNRLPFHCLHPCLRVLSHDAVSLL